MEPEFSPLERQLSAQLRDELHAIPLPTQRWRAVKSTYDHRHRQLRRRRVLMACAVALILAVNVLSVAQRVFFQQPQQTAALWPLKPIYDMTSVQPLPDGRMIARMERSPVALELVMNKRVTAGTIEITEVRTHNIGDQPLYYPGARFEVRGSALSMRTDIANYTSSRPVDMLAPGATTTDTLRLYIPYDAALPNVDPVIWGAVSYYVAPVGQESTEQQRLEAMREAEFGPVALEVEQPTSERPSGDPAAPLIPLYPPDQTVETLEEAEAVLGVSLARLQHPFSEMTLDRVEIYLPDQDSGGTASTIYRLEHGGEVQISERLTLNTAGDLGRYAQNFTMQEVPLGIKGYLMRRMGNWHLAWSTSAREYSIVAPAPYFSAEDVLELAFRVQ